jgi:hypothetical protein
MEPLMGEIMKGMSKDFDREGATLATSLNTISNKIPSAADQVGANNAQLVEGLNQKLIDTQEDINNVKSALWLA